MRIAPVLKLIMALLLVVTSILPSRCLTTIHRAIQPTQPVQCCGMASLTASCCTPTTATNRCVPPSPLSNGSNIQTCTCTVAPSMPKVPLKKSESTFGGQMEYGVVSHLSHCVILVSPCTPLTQCLPAVALPDNNLASPLSSRAPPF